MMLEPMIQHLDPKLRPKMASTNDINQLEAIANKWNLEDYVETLEAKIIELNPKVTELEAKIEELEARIEELQPNILKLDSKILELNPKLSFERNVLELDAYVQVLQPYIQHLEAKITELDGGVAENIEYLNRAYDGKVDVVEFLDEKVHKGKAMSDVKQIGGTLSRECIKGGNHYKGYKASRYGQARTRRERRRLVTMERLGEEIRMAATRD